jgi:hypothetical protein
VVTQVLAGQAVEVTVDAVEMLQAIILLIQVSLAMLEVGTAQGVEVAEVVLVQLTVILLVLLEAAVAELVVLCMSMLNKTLSPQVN